jgi:hypothetical protein
MAKGRLQEPTIPVARFDRIYVLYRNCVLNQDYYGHRLQLFSKVALWLEVIIVIGSGASGVSGWIIWTKYPASAVLWGIIAATATLLAAVKPVLHIDTKLKHYSMLFSGYRQLSLTMKMVVDEIAESAGIPREIEREVERVRTRYQNLSEGDDPRPSIKLVKRLQAQIEDKIPIWSLFYPDSNALPTTAETPALSVESDTQSH